jgi:hypothetical protein
VINYRFVSLVLFVIALGVSSSASAQEKVVVLEKGSTVWQVLNNAGCTDDQIASVWRIVVADSGLDPKNDKFFAIGTPIVVRRDCQGNPLANAALEALTAEKDALISTVAGLRTELETARTEVGVLEERLAHTASARDNWRRVAITAMVLLIVGFFALAWAVLYRRTLIDRTLALERELAKDRDAHKAEVVGLNATIDGVRHELEETQNKLRLTRELLDEEQSVRTFALPNSDDVVVKRQIIVEHHGKDVVANLKEVTPQYQCPVPNCGASVFERNFIKHMRTAHGDYGRIDDATTLAADDVSNNIYGFPSESEARTA